MFSRTTREATYLVVVAWAWKTPAKLAAAARHAGRILCLCLHVLDASPLYAGSGEMDGVNALVTEDAQLQRYNAALGY